MSASERLRELDAATPLEKYEIDLFRALPEILAVVERAEWIQSYHHIHSERADDCPDELCRALIALEEKLKP